MGTGADPRPRVAVAGDNVIVTDPLNARLHLVNAETLRGSRRDCRGRQALQYRRRRRKAAGSTTHDGEEEHAHNHDHAHDHGDEPDLQRAISKTTRSRSARSRTGQATGSRSIPYLQDGTLDQVMEHKAESGDQSADEYKAYYEIGYRTDVERIVIEGDTVTFFEDGKPLQARYASDSFEVLT